MTSRHDRAEPAMTRRQLLLRTATTCGLMVGAGVWGYLFYSDEPIRRRDRKIFTFKDFRVPESGLYPQLAIAHGTDVLKMVRAVVERLGGVSRFIQRGDRVLIKPNAGWDRQPEQAANTNPDAVGVVVRLCIEAGASEVWVTDVSINDPYRSFSRSGIESAVRNSGGTVKYAGENDFVSTDLKGQVLTVWPVSRFFHEVDKVINMPVVKHHSLSRCTIAMKNWYGVLGGRRNRLHQEIDVSITDLSAAIRPTLTITDATRVLKRNGPTGGNLSDVSVENTVVAGLDEVALDAYCLRFLDLTVDAVPFLGLAERRGVGVSDWRSLPHVELSVG